MHSKDTSSPGTSQKSELLLDVKYLSRKVSGNWIWENISFELSAGQRLALSGKSGSGKSMLLRSLAGLDVLEKGPSGEEGSINFSGKSIAEWEMPEFRTRIGYVPQHQAFPDETVEECFKRVFTLKANQNKFYNRIVYIYLLFFSMNSVCFSEAARSTNQEKHLQKLTRTQNAYLILFFLKILVAKLLL